MVSKRYKKLPKKTKELKADVIEKLIPELKKKLYYQIWWVIRLKYTN